MLDREAITKVRDFRTEKVEVWGDHVFVRTLTCGQRDDFVSTCINENTGKVSRNVKNVTARLLAWSVCNEAGELLFPNMEEGIQVFRLKAADQCGKLFDAAAELNGLTEADVKKIVEDFPETPSAGSSSD